MEAFNKGDSDYIVGKWSGNPVCLACTEKVHSPEGLTDRKQNSMLRLLQWIYFLNYIFSLFELYWVFMQISLSCMADFILIGMNFHRFSLRMESHSEWL